MRAWLLDEHAQNELLSDLDQSHATFSHPQPGLLRTSHIHMYPNRSSASTAINLFLSSVSLRKVYRRKIHLVHQNPCFRTHISRLHMLDQLFPIASPCMKSDSNSSPTLASALRSSRCDNTLLPRKLAKSLFPTAVFQKPLNILATTTSQHSDSGLRHWPGYR